MLLDKLEREIQKSLEMATPGTDHFARLLKDLEEVRKIKTIGLTAHNDTVIMATSSIIGMLLLMNFEKLHIVTSRAFSLIPRIR